MTELSLEIAYTRPDEPNGGDASDGEEETNT